jgi:tRNA threonylcarbamoyladenosine biosynthesis protein TsaE
MIGVEGRKNASPPDFEMTDLDEPAVERLAGHIARASKGGEIFLLEGPLGAGKTFFTRAFAAALGLTSGVNSPTYVLHCVHETPAGLTLHHLDFYRLSRDREAGDLGLEELAHPGSIVMVEWANRCPSAFDAFTLRLRFEILDDGRRRITGWKGSLPLDLPASDL